MQRRTIAAVSTGAALATLAAMAMVVPGPARVGASQDKPAERVANRHATLQGRVDALALAGIPGVVARLDDGSRHWTAAAGVGDVTHPSPLSPQARFRVGSVTKTFVASVALQLVDEGRLELDAPVATWLPALLPDGDAITLRHLLGHRSGIADYLSDGGVWQGIEDNRVFRPEELVAVATGSPLHFPPGSSWSYSNTNYIVVGLIVERVTGDSLESELQRRILGPLGLGHTSFPTTSARIDGVHAHGYVLPPGAPPLDLTWVNPSHAWAAGALVSTAGDLSRFYRALLAGDVLGPRMMDAMMSTSAVGPREAYGLGLMRKTTPCGAFWGHDGDIPGYGAWSFHAEDGSRSMTDLRNLSGTELPAGVDAAEDALRSLLCDGPA